jgi:hypothetical protein
MGSKVPLPWPWAARLPLQEKCHNFFVYWPIFDLKPGKFAHVHGASSGYLRLRKPLQVGGVDPRVIYLFRVRSAEVHGIGWRQASNDACWRRHRARRCFWVAGTVSGPYPFEFFRTMERLQGFGRTSGDLPTSADTCLRGHATSLNSGCLLRQTAGALIVALLVTIQGSASCA